MCAGGPGSIPGVDKLDCGFRPSGVGKMSSICMELGDPLHNTAKLSVGSEMIMCDLCSQWPHVIPYWLPRAPRKYLKYLSRISNARLYLLT